METDNSGESNTIIRLIVCVTLFFLVYGFYFGVVFGYDYPNKQEHNDMVVLLIVFSMMAFLGSVSLYVGGDAPKLAAMALFASMVIDYVTGSIIGTSALVPDENNGQKLETNYLLVYATYSPMLYKTFLFGWLVMNAGVEAYCGEEVRKTVGMDYKRKAIEKWKKQFGKQTQTNQSGDDMENIGLLGGFINW